MSEIPGQEISTPTAGLVTLTPHVYWHKKSQKWMAMCVGRCPQTKYLGLFCSPAEAAKAITHHIREVHTLVTPQKNLFRNLPAFHSHFIALADTFGHCLPGDLETAYQADVYAQEMYQSDPIFEVLSIQGKIGPWKEALWKSWKKLSLQEPGPSEPAAPATLEHRVMFAWRVLSDVVMDMNKVKFSNWAQSTGRNNQYHSGWLSMIQDIKIVSKQRQHSRAKRVELGESGSKYWMCKQSQSTEPLTGLAAAADLLTTILKDPPITASDWLTKMAAARPFLPHQPISSNNSKGLRPHQPKSSNNAKGSPPH